MLQYAYQRFLLFHFGWIWISTFYNENLCHENGNIQILPDTFIHFWHLQKCVTKKTCFFHNNWLLTFILGSWSLCVFECLYVYSANFIRVEIVSHLWSQMLLFLLPITTSFQLFASIIHTVLWHNFATLICSHQISPPPSRYISRIIMMSRKKQYQEGYVSHIYFIKWIFYCCLIEAYLSGHTVEYWRRLAAIFVWSFDCR